MIRSVAVVGAGAAGLVTARELLRAGFEVTVFEEAHAPGGVWIYTPNVESDPLGQVGERIHSSLYASLHTNLPRDIMAFDDYPFDSSGGGHDDWPRFPEHTRVLEYLERFTRDFDLEPHIQFRARVTALEPTASGWRMRIAQADGEALREFDAVAVCSGHFAAPRVPQLDGADAFPGTQMHSHNYREPSAFRDRRVALLGTSASGLDLSREIAGVAARTYWCGELFDELPDAHRHEGRLSRLPAIDALRSDGRLVLRDGSTTEPVDDLVYCTGYHYRYPFIDSTLLTIDDNWVQPLYRDLLHIEHPTLALVGVPFRVLPFPLFEMQARWFARLLGGHFRLPPASAMHDHTAREIEALRAKGVKQRHFHQRTIDCFDYLDALADEAGVARAPAWRRQTAAALLAVLEKSRGNARNTPIPHFAPTVVPDDSIAR